MKKLNGGVTAARGFKCAGVSCGIKSARNALDLGLIVSDAPAAAACTFTTNRVQAAPIIVSRQRLGRRRMRGLVVNAGNANACTGKRGLRDAERMAEAAGAELGVPPETLFVASTGIIGHRMPMDRVACGIRKAARALGASADHNTALAEAIMTTDLVRKSASVECRIGNRGVRIGGVAKGSGMIAPNMATMLAFLTTDCAIQAGLLRKALREVVRRTFNRVTVDGDCSTNDMAACLANGLAENRPVQTTGKAYDAFVDGLLAVCTELSRAIARDGEGATKLITVRVTGASSEKTAHLVARSIAESPLVKTAIFGGDPNWGRIICAAGNSGADVAPDRMTLKLNSVCLFRGGSPRSVAGDRLTKCMQPKEIAIELDLGQGRAETTMWTCDLTGDYIRINAEYHT